MRKFHCEVCPESRTWSRVGEKLGLLPTHNETPPHGTRGSHRSRTVISLRRTRGRGRVRSSARRDAKSPIWKFLLTRENGDVESSRGMRKKAKETGRGRFRRRERGRIRGFQRGGTSSFLSGKWSLDDFVKSFEFLQCPRMRRASLYTFIRKKLPPE